MARVPQYTERERFERHRRLYRQLGYVDTADVYYLEKPPSEIHRIEVAEPVEIEEDDENMPRSLGRIAAAIEGKVAPIGKLNNSAPVVGAGNSLWA